MGGLLPKPETTKHTQDGSCSSGRWSFGVSEMQGWRRGMEDAHLTLPDFDPARQLGLFGVFDGHGGAAVAKVAARRLPDTLRELPSFQEGRYQEALYEAFLRLDAFLDSPSGRREVVAETTEDATGDEDEESAIQELIASGQLSAADVKRLADDNDGDEEDAEAEDAEEEDGDFEEGEEEAAEGEEEEEEEQEGEGNSLWASGEGPDGMGSTAVVALVRGGESPEVICANAGDSRCVLARGTRAVNMSRDHKPTLKSERKRIALAGGFVTAEGRVDGNLNLSRALGDFAYKKDASRKPTEQKISGEAEVRCKPLTELDRYLLLGCDGIFEKVTSQELVDFILPRLRSQRRSRSPAPLSAACSAFLDENVAKNPAKEQGMGCDNMTLMLVDLQADSSPAALGRMAGSVAGGKAAAASHCKVNGGSPRRKGPRTQRLITKDGVRRTVRSPGRRRLLLMQRRSPRAASPGTAAGGGPAVA